MEQKKLTANIRGRVQGVSFRYYTRQRALQLGLCGWVRNERDGSVQLVAEGASDRLEQLLAYVHKGPIGAHVTRVEHSYSEAQGQFIEFEIRWL